MTANYQVDTVSVVVDNGDGTFGSKHDFGTGYGPGSVALSDLNGDGKLDLATANAGEEQEGGASVLLNRGNGSFEAKQDYATGGGPESVALGVGD